MPRPRLRCYSSRVASPFGNNSSDGYSANSYKYEPKWQKDVDYSPDHRPSDSAMYIESVRPSGIRWFLQVKGLGVLTLFTTSRQSDPLGKCQPSAMGEFTKVEVGYCPDL
jgi:hypothetical protein